MIYECNACKRVYEINRTDVTCIYCGASSCHPYEAKEKEETQ